MKLSEARKSICFSRLIYLHPLILENAYKQNNNQMDNNASTVANETVETVDAKETKEVKVRCSMSAY